MCGLYLISLSSWATLGSLTIYVVYITNNKLLFDVHSMLFRVWIYDFIRNAFISLKTREYIQAYFHIFAGKVINWVRFRFLNKP